MSEFKREMRYEVWKLKDGAGVDCVVVEAEGWNELERRVMRRFATENKR